MTSTQARRSVRTVLISGAGIAGPSLAYWLHRHGFEATVVERSTFLRDSGGAVDFRGEQVRLLKAMGIFDAVKAAERTGRASASASSSTPRTWLTTAATSQRRSSWSRRPTPTPAGRPRPC